MQGREHLMARQFWKLWAQSLVDGIRRFPLGWLASIAAAIAAISMNHKHQLGMSDIVEGYLFRVLLLWPFAVFGNIALGLRAERNKGSSLVQQLALLVMLVVAWFLLPPSSAATTESFWFGYGAAVVTIIIASVVVPVRRIGEPGLWDAGWPMAQAIVMATFTAIIAAGGINAAIFSIERLFAVKINHRTYFDVVMTGFFLIAPVTAFAWFPAPFGAAQSQPGWLKGAVRILLVPLSLLYALILFAYIARIALAARWPDGWVALPTLVFAVIGLTGYLIARTARDRASERWAIWYCRILPIALIPVAIVLLMAMQVRIADYGFTEWRTIGLFLGVWILGFAACFAARPNISVWWVAASLGVTTLLAVPGPSAISRFSQAARLERRLEHLGFHQEQGETLKVSKEDRDDLRSVIEYILSHHGKEALPRQIAEQWDKYLEARQLQPPPPVRVRPRYYNARSQADEVLEALGIESDKSSAPSWLVFSCESTPMQLGNWTELRVFQPNAFPKQVLSSDDSRKDAPLSESALLWVNNELEVMTQSNQVVAAKERAAFIDSLEQHIADVIASGTAISVEITMPPELLGYGFSHEGQDYRIQFFRVSRSQSARSAKPLISLSYNYNGAVLLIGPARH